VAEVVLVGNNLAVLVAAAELGTAGREVVLLTDGRAAGGHFRGLPVEGTDFDIGAVLLDRAPPTGAAGEPDTDPRTYAPERRYDWTRFGALVDDWVAGQVGTRRTPTRRCSSADGAGRTT